MIDILNCAKGCLFGTGTQEGIDEQKVYNEISKQRKKAEKEAPKSRFKMKKTASWTKNATPAERYEALCRQFEKLDYNDFVRKYSADAKDVKEPSQAEENRIFTEMNKERSESRISRLVSIAGCTYRFIVTFTLECPSSSLTLLTSAPLLIQFVAKVWRRV